MGSQIKRGLRATLRRAGAGARSIARALDGLEARLLTPAFLEQEQKRGVAAAMASHDMVDSPDEAYYRDRYWDWIEGEAERTGLDFSGRLLDAGCGSGRLLQPLARRAADAGGRVTGVDFLPDSIAAASRHIHAAGLNNVDLHEADLLTFLVEQPPATYSGCLFFEVAFVLPNLTEVLNELGRVLRPNAPLFASFRTRWYWALLAVQRRDWELLGRVREETAGVVPGAGFQTWHSAADVRAVLGAAGFGDVCLQAVGPCSGIAGDPLAAVARPSALGHEGRRALAAAETDLGASNPDCGRYVIASAVRDA